VKKAFHVCQLYSCMCPLADQINLSAKSREAHLRAEVNILKRTNLRFKGDKALELKKMSKVGCTEMQ